MEVYKSSIHGPVFHSYDKLLTYSSIHTYSNLTISHQICQIWQHDSGDIWNAFFDPGKTRNWLELSETQRPRM